MLEQGRHQLPAETEGELRRQRFLVGEAADAVRAEEAPHQRSWAKPTRTTDGVIRTTLTPGGTMIRSGARPTTTSPGREPARLMRTRSASGATRKSAERSPWSWTSTVSGRSLVTVSPEGMPSSSTGRGRVTLVFSELMTKTQRAAEKARASRLSPQWCTSQARTTASLPQPVPRGLPPGLLGGHGRGLEREELGETVTEGVVVLRALEAPFHGEGDAARLLRHHEDDGVRLLAEPEGRAMPRPHGAPELRVARQRQEAPPRRHPPGREAGGPRVRGPARGEGGCALGGTG